MLASAVLKPCRPAINPVRRRSFERTFELADFIRVRSADLADGLLTADLVREVPDAMKPHTIDIDSSKPVVLGEAKQTDDGNA